MLFVVMRVNTDYCIKKTTLSGIREQNETVGVLFFVPGVLVCQSCPIHLARQPLYIIEQHYRPILNSMADQDLT